MNWDSTAFFSLSAYFVIKKKKKKDKQNVLIKYNGKWHRKSLSRANMLEYLYFIRHLMCLFCLFQCIFINLSNAFSVYFSAWADPTLFNSWSNWFPTLILSSRYIYMALISGKVILITWIFFFLHYFTLSHQNVISIRKKKINLNMCENVKFHKIKMYFTNITESIFFCYFVS